MYIIFLTAVIFHIGALFFTSGNGFKSDLSERVIIYSTIDLILNMLVVACVYYKFPVFFNRANIYFKEYYIKTFESITWLLVLLVLYAGYLASQSFSLILAGALRHELLQEYETAGLAYMLISGFFKMFLPFMFFFQSSYKLKLIAVIGLLFTIIITASRSELMYVINFYIVLLILSKNNTKVIRLIMLASLMVFSAIIATVFLQNRPISDGFNALMDMARTIFQYRSYSYHLSEIVLEVSSSAEKVIFPFFGYVSEFITKHTFGLSNPVDSEFVGELHNLGTNPITKRPYLANTIYPWWSWFVGPFGMAGLFIKAVYCFVLLVFCIAGRFLFTFVILLSFIVFGTAGAHPLLTLTHTFAIFICFAIDIFVLCYTKFFLDREKS